MLASIVLVVSAPIPIVLFRFQQEEAVVWRVASGLALTINLLGLAQVFRAGQESGLNKADRFYMPIAYTIEVPIDLVLIVNVFALVPEHMAALFMTFRVLLLSRAAVVFVGLLASLFDPSEAK